jgi:hypothetical protein
MSKPVVFPHKKLINLTDEMVARIVDFRFEHRLSSENEAIRRLIEIGLETAGYGLKSGTADD